MNTETTGLAALARPGPENREIGRGVPRPPFRWSTRVLLPLAVLAVGAGLLLYSARAALRPAVAVRVTPVVAKAPALPTEDDAAATPGEGGNAPAAAAAPAVSVQAPGWIEPAPFAASVPALTEGVVYEVLVLEGERVEKGQVVARLIDADARLTLQRSEAELAEARAMAAQAAAEAEAAEARIAEVQQELDRRRPLSGTGVVAEGEITQLERRVQTARLEAVVARAAVAAAEARAATHGVVCDEARLALSRTEIVSPVSGVVLNRLIEPGVRIAMAPAGAGEALEAGVMRIYDPDRLQVRVDVPLADAAKVGLGTRAEVTTEALPGTAFAGEVVRVVHQADIQRNTVQFKVAIQDPTEDLKPEMLTKVRFTIGGGTVARSGAIDGGSANPDGLRLFALESALLERSPDGGRAAAWVVDHTGISAAARRRELRVGGVDAEGYVEVLEGLRPGDRLVVDPPAGLREGARVKVQRGAQEGAEP